MATTTLPSEEPPPDYLNPTQAGAYLSISPRTLERYRIHGTGPVYIKVGRGIRAKVLYRRADIDAWLEANAHMKTDEYVKRKKRDDIEDEPNDDDSPNRRICTLWARLNEACGELVRPWAMSDFALDV